MVGTNAMPEAGTLSRLSAGSRRAPNQSRSNPPFRRKVLFETLEQRLLLSAELPSGLAVAASGALQQEEQNNASVLTSADLQASPTPVTISSATLYAGSVDNVWRITGPDQGTLNGQPFSGTGTLIGGADNKDTFIFETDGSLSGYLDGGAGGFDSLVIEGGNFTQTRYSANGRDSGTVELDGKVIAYKGLEPITDNSNTATRVFTATAGDDRIRLRDGPSGQITIEAQGATFESITFPNPTTSLMINADNGNDAITVDSLGADFTASITVNGGDGTDSIQAIRTGNLVLNDSKLTSGAESITLSSIEQAVVGGNVLNTAAFTGPIIAAAGAPEWISQGPGPIHGGQVTGIENKPVTGAVQAIVTVPGSANTLYIGSVNGGVWKTVDGGATWKPLTDQLPSLSIGALTLDRGDATHQTLYAGTGKVSSLNHIGRAVGLLKTTDAGQTWSLIRNSAFDDNPVSAITANGDVVLVGTNTGLFRSADGGLSFSRISGEFGPPDGKDNDGDLAFDEIQVTAVEIKSAGTNYKEKDFVAVVGGVPTNPSQVADLKVTRVGADGVVTGIEVFNGGEYSFAPGSPASTTTEGAGTDLTVNLTAFGPAEERLVRGTVSDLAVDPSNPSRIYVALESGGVFLSEDEGLQFAPVNTGIDLDRATRVRLSVSPAVDPATGNHPVYAGVVKNARVTLTAAAEQGATELTLDRVDNLSLKDLVAIGRGATADTGNKIVNIDPVTKTIILETALKHAHATGEVLSVTKKSARVDAIYRSDNHGTTWTRMDVPGDRDGGISTGAQAETHFSILADRTDPNVVFVGGDRQPHPFLIANSTGAIDSTGRLFRGDASAAAGSQWQSVTDIFADPDGPVPRTAPHADSRTMVFDENGNIVEGDDGGVFRLLNPNTLATRQWVTLNGDLRLTELHSVGYDSVNHIIVGGAQDNGTSRQNGPGDPVWTKLLGGDGGVVNVANSATESIKYISAQEIGNFRAISNLDTGGDGRDLEVNDSGSFFDDDELVDFDDTVQFRQPIILNQVDPSRLLLGTSFIYEEDPDFPGLSDPGDDVSLRDGKPDVKGGKSVPDPNFTVGKVTALAYGGRERNSAGALIDKPDIAFVAGGKGFYVRLAKGGHFVPMTSWKDGPPGGADVKDIVLNPENWRKVYVIDSKSRVWLGELSTDGTPTATWTELTGNLPDMLALGGKTNELFTIELMFDHGTNTGSAADDTTVLLVGGFGGVFRAINPDATSAQWAEFGTGMPNTLVADLHYDARDDILVAGTLGRGAFAIANAGELLKRDSTLTITGSSSGEAIDLVRNAASPWMVDVFLFDAAGTKPDNPAASFQLSSFRHIVIDGKGGDDIVTVDSTNGPLSVIQIEGGQGTDTFNLRGPAPISSRTGANTVEVTGIDAFGDDRTQLAIFSGFEVSPAAVGALSALAAVGPAPDVLASTRGGLGGLGDASRGLVDHALRGKELPFLRAPSLNEAFHGDILEPEEFFGDPLEETAQVGSTGSRQEAGHASAATNAAGEESGGDDQGAGQGEEGEEKKKESAPIRSWK